MENSNNFEEVKKIFNINQFRTSQHQIINDIIDGKDVLVIMPTGMGKSLCYQFPAMLFKGLTIVISPLISLMKDQVDALHTKGVPAVYINSSLSRYEREKRYKDISDGKYKLLYISPERFRKDEFRDAIHNRKISLLAIDEVHCISQWGNDFRPDYSKIKYFRKILNNPVTIALTATATKKVIHDIIEKIGLKESEIKIYNEGICRPNLFLTVDEVIDDNEKYETILEKISSISGNKIIYFTLIKGIEKFSKFLDTKKIKYIIYHGKLSAEQKQRVQKEFAQKENTLVLATNAFGMGIDKSNIRLIIHAEIPDSIESYYQEIGRAGRDSKYSECLLIYSQNDLAVQLDFLKWKNPDAIFIKNCYSLLKSLGSAINSYTYDEIQEKLVYKNRGDHRLQTVLNLYDKYNVSEGSLDNYNFKIINELPSEIIDEIYIEEKLESDRVKLLNMFNYIKSTDCRRDFIHNYFNLKSIHCNHCDNCKQLNEAVI